MKAFQLRFVLAVLLVRGFVLAGVAADAAPKFTLEQVMSAPFSSDLTAAPAKGRVAWVFNAEGRRNVWVAEPAADGAYRSRQLTHYSADDGQDLGELAWSADAETVVFTRGGDLETIRSYPNAASSPEGAEQNIWEIPFAGGEPKKLGEGYAATLSPKSRALTYIFKDQIWLTNLDAGAKPTQLIHAVGKARTPRWSPDGARLAFVNNRGDHSFVGVYNFAAKSLTYLDPSVDRDSEPAWSPDGKRVAFIRTPTSKPEILARPRREGFPWSIRVADASTGQGREVWHADPGAGSVFHGLVADSQLIWTMNDSIVFPWEKTGWSTLYAVDVTLSTAEKPVARKLTADNFEVECVSPGPDAATVVYSSNQGDIDGRHVWLVSVSSGEPPKALTRGTEIENYPVSLGGGRFAMLHADARMPMRPAMLAADGALRDLAPQAQPKEFPASALIVPQPVVIDAADGMKIHCQLFLPPGAGEGQKRPAVVFSHGGSRRQMLLGWHYMDYYSNAYAMNQYLASRGFVVLSVNYRSGIGYGMEFREALNYGAAGASEFNDVLGAGLYLKGRPEVDPKRIACWGGSYGGYLTALALARASDLFAAGVDLHGVHDWNLELPTFTPEYDPRERADFARVALTSSPISSVSTWRSPVLLIHGDDDRNVPFAETVQLVEALRKQKVEFEELIFPDEIHDFLLRRDWIRAYTTAEDFLTRKLGGPKDDRH